MAIPLEQSRTAEILCPLSSVTKRELAALQWSGMAEQLSSRVVPGEATDELPVVLLLDSIRIWGRESYVREAGTAGEAEEPVEAQGVEWECEP